MTDESLINALMMEIEEKIPCSGSRFCAVTSRISTETPTVVEIHHNGVRDSHYIGIVMMAFKADAERAALVGDIVRWVKDLHNWNDSHVTTWTTEENGERKPHEFRCCLH